MWIWGQVQDVEEDSERIRDGPIMRMSTEKMSRVPMVRIVMWMVGFVVVEVGWLCAIVRRFLSCLQSPMRYSLVEVELWLCAGKSFTFWRRLSRCQPSRNLFIQSCRGTTPTKLSCSMRG